MRRGSRLGCRNGSRHDGFCGRIVGDGLALHVGRVGEVTLGRTTATLLCSRPAPCETNTVSMCTTHTHTHTHHHRGQVGQAGIA